MKSVLFPSVFIVYFNFNHFLVMNMHVVDSCFRHLGICDNFSFLPLYTLTLLLFFNVYSSRIVFSAVSLSERYLCGISISRHSVQWSESYNILEFN